MESREDREGQRQERRQASPTLGMLYRSVEHPWLMGLFWLCMAVLADRQFLEHVIVDDGHISSRGIRWLLALFELGALCLGGWILLVRPKIRYGTVILAALVSVTCLALSEIVLAVFYHSPGQTVGWRTDAPPVERNQLGYRGRSIDYQEEDVVVVLVGDSQVEAKACAYAWMPERRLEDYLKRQGKPIKVFSLGASGYGQGEQLLALREYFAGGYRANLVIVWLTPGNDLVDNTFSSSWKAKTKVPTPTFWLENGVLQGPSEQIGDTMPVPRINLAAQIERLFPIDRDMQWAKRLPPPYEAMEQYDGPLDAPVYGYGFETSIGKQVLSEDRTALSMMLVPRSPRIQYGVDITVALLKEMEKSTVDQGGEFATFVAEPRDLFPMREYVQELFGKYYRVSTAEYHRVIQDVTRNFASYAVSPTLEEWAVGPEDGHLNEHATDEAMASLAAQLEKSLR